MVVDMGMGDNYTSARLPIIHLRELKVKGEKGPMNNHHNDVGTQYHTQGRAGKHHIFLIRNVVAQQSKGRKREEKGVR